MSSVRLPTVLFLLGVGSYVAYRLYSFVSSKNELQRKRAKSPEPNESTMDQEPIKQTPILPGLNWSALADLTQVNRSNCSDCSLESIEQLVKRLQAERNLVNLDQLQTDESKQLLEEDGSVADESILTKTPESVLKNNLDDSQIFQGGTICKLNRLLGQLNEVKQSCEQLDQSLIKVQEQPPLSLSNLNASEPNLNLNLSFSCLEPTADTFHLSALSEIERSKQFEKDISFDLSTRNMNAAEDRLNSTEQNMTWLMNDDSSSLNKMTSFVNNMNAEIKKMRAERSMCSSMLQDKQNQTSDGESEQEEDWPFESSRDVRPTDDQPNSIDAISLQNEEATLEWDSTDVVLFPQDEPEELLSNKSLLELQSESIAAIDKSMQSSLGSIEQARDDSCWSSLLLSAEEQALLSNLSGRFNHLQVYRSSNSSDCSLSVCSDDSIESHERTLQQLVQEAKKQGVVRDLMVRLRQHAENDA